MTSPDRTKSNRREFLLGRSFLESLSGHQPPSLPAGRFDSVTQSKASTPRSAEAEKTEIERVDRFQRQRLEGLPTHYWEQFTKRAMACQFEILLNLHQYPQGALAVGEAFQLIDQLEEQLTIYRQESEISQVNRQAFQQPIVVESQLFQLLQLSLQLFHQTKGAFDITAGPLSVLWGFTQRTGKLPDPQALQATLASVGSDQLVLDQTQQSVQFLNQQLQINLGGIGKGYALDRAQGLLRSCGVNDFILHGGQSSVIAGGSDLTTATEHEKSHGWSVGLSHPVLPQLRLAEIRLVNQALGTSGSARQNFYSQGKQYGHIIDPRTGWPSGRFLSTTVLADSAAQADALATAFYLMDLDQISEYCSQNPNVTTILLSHPAQRNQQPLDTTELLMQTFNLNEDQLKLLGPK